METWALLPYPVDVSHVAYAWAFSYERYAAECMDINCCMAKRVRETLRGFDRQM